MEKKKVLYVTQEMKPYLLESDIASIAHRLPPYMQNEGMEIRVLMPRFGKINERRHRLHEVVRLSGINIIVDGDDYPLMIKVASLPGYRLQVYFLDNEEFFERKGVFYDKEDRFYEDNVERMIFFCKGAIETVRKFGWPPDIIHLHGWMTSLIPLYLKTAYKNDPIFKKSKIIYSVYNTPFKETLKEKFYQKVPHGLKSISEEDLKYYQEADFTGLNLGASKFADAIIEGSETIDELLQKAIAENGMPVLPYVEGEKLTEAYKVFYQSLLEN